MTCKKIIFYILLIITIPIVIGIGILFSFINFPILLLIFIGYLFIYEKYVNKKKD
jgi:hypothetical protein